LLNGLCGTDPFKACSLEQLAELPGMTLGRRPQFILDWRSWKSVVFVAWVF